MRLLPPLFLVLSTAAIRADEADAIKKLEGRGAVIRRDEKAAGRPAVGATLTGDAGADASLEDLRALGQLRELHLSGWQLQRPGVEGVEAEAPDGLPLGKVG